MDKIAYKEELNEIRYTEAGRAALVEQLMAAQAVNPPDQRKRWGRKGLLMVLAAVLLVTAAAAATAPVWLSFFGGLDGKQQEVVANMETAEDGLPPAVEADGVTITPLSILGSQNQLYIMLEIRAPEGTVFTENGNYYLSSTVRPKVKPTEMLGHGGRFTVLEAGTKEPNVLTGIDEISASYDLGGGTYRVNGLVGEEPGEWIFRGVWDIPLPEDLTGNQVLEPPVEGVSVETEYGTFTLDSIGISPLGILWQYQFDGVNEPVIYVALKMKDGSIVEPNPERLITGDQGSGQTSTASFEKPVDLSQAASLYWGNVEIPLDGQGEIAAAEDVPVISYEPPFYNPSVSVKENGNEAGEPEKLGVWKREIRNNEVAYSVTGGSAASYSQAPAWRPTWLPEGWSMNSITRVSGPENTAVQMIYQNGTESLHFICFRPVERTCLGMAGSDGRQAASVKGRTADFYRADYNLLVWTDDAGNLFKLIGRLNQAVLERIADSVAEASQKAMPQYQLGWTPEGCANTSRTTNIPSVVRETWRDADTVSFEWLCIRNEVLTVPEGTPEAVTVNGIPAQFWTGDPNGGLDVNRDGVKVHAYTDDQKNVLLWTDPETNLTFRFRGMMSKDEMIRMAESLTTEK